MDVDLKPTNEHQEVAQNTKTMCANVMCLNNLVIMNLTHEDADTVQYDGACSTCGGQYHLILDKESA